MMINNLKHQWRFYQNYLIIGLLSMLSVFVLPMLGSALGIGLTVPNTFAGWVVYLATKACIVTINILIFDQFVKQAKVNVRDNEYFQEAERILMQYKATEEAILPAQTYIRKMYRKKGTTTAIFTILGVFGLTNAILTFDWVSMLSYSFTIIMGLIFGWISMNQAEEIWIEKHYKYAKKVERDAKEKAEREAKEAKEKAEREAKELLEMAKEEVSEQVDDTAIPTGGVDLLEPYDIYSSDGNISEPVVVDSSSECTACMGNDSSGNTDADDFHSGLSYSN